MVLQFKVAATAIISLLATLMQIVLGYLEVEPEGDLGPQTSAIQQLVEEMHRQGHVLNDLAACLGAKPSPLFGKQEASGGPNSKPASESQSSADKAHGDSLGGVPGTMYPREWGPTPSPVEMKELGPRLWHSSRGQFRM